MMPGQLASLNDMGRGGQGVTYAGFGATPPNSGLAVASLVCGIISVLGACFWGLGAVLGLVAIGLGIGAIAQVKNNSGRMRGKGMAIGGITTGIASIPLAVVLVTLVYVPMFKQFSSIGYQAVCQEQLASVAAALHAYAENDPNGEFPDDLQRLIDNGDIAAQELTCPSDPTGARSYFYVPGYSLESDSDQVLVYEHPDIHANDASEFTTSGGAVIYLDGRVDFLDSAKFLKLINKIRTPDGKRFAPHEE